jgi:hypothetical protein
MGSYIVWGQHSGVPARLTGVHCYKGGTIFDLITPDCEGQLSGTPQSVSIWNGWLGDEGDDINVHTHGTGDAFKDSWLQPLIWLGLGFLAAGGAIRAIVRRLRPAPVVPDEPWARSQ